jgi:putative ABC transport system ATP-binding protein
MALLEARDVRKVYGVGTRGEVRALDGVSLAVAAASFTALTGPSGSGKTTLLALLGALERPTAGRVLFDGRDLAGFSGGGLARVRRRLGFLFQDFALIPSLPAWENVTYPLIPRGVPGPRRREIAREVLGRLGVADKWSARPGELSGGEQQRVALARALAGGPEALLADEPTAQLDPGAAQAVLAALGAAHAAGAAVLVCTHDPLLLAAAGRVHELRAGRLVLPG